MPSGYTTTTTEGGALTVAELGTVDCATGWTNTTAVPSATCVRQMSEPVQDFEFVLSGCAEKACTAPAVGQVAGAPYEVESTGTVASALTLSCGPSGDGTPSAVCETEDDVFEYSGCEWRTCAAPNEEVPTGYSAYSVPEPSGTTVLALGTVSCAAGHEPAGLPSATCAETNGVFVLEGCEEPPQQSKAVSRLAAALPTTLLALGASWLCL